jgi:hypothetical protein
MDASINFAEDVAAASGERIEVRILSGPTASNAVGSAVLLPAGASDTVLTRTYRPPARYANYDSGGTRRLAAEQIGFTLIRRRIADAEILEQRDFTREVRIEATTTFVGDVINQVLRRATPYPSGLQACTNCHTETGQAEFFRFDAGVTRQSLYDEVRLRIDLEDPAASIMLCRPSNDCLTPPVHPGGDRDPNGLAGDDDDLAPIRRWLEEGANNF